MKARARAKARDMERGIEREVSKEGDLEAKNDEGMESARQRATLRVWCDVEGKISSQRRTITLTIHDRASRDARRTHGGCWGCGLDRQAACEWRV